MIDTGSVAWVLASTALVLLMTPALGLFYGGMVRKKNFLSVLMLVFASLMLVIIQWFLLGYSLAFGTTQLGIIGGLEHLGFAGVGFDTLRGLEIPDLLFAAFQMTFAGLTLAIIVSGVAERIRFGAFLVFGILWTTLVYDPLAHWLWGGGWLAQLGALDYAGGTVVHISAGFGALALAIYIGKRSGFGVHSLNPQNIPMTFFAG
ncbi:MAG TPA: ammonium transporter, partial [Methanocorpusculum sp.]|nr:ammonium transporter [Methanocorpusculum sp.]